MQPQWVRFVENVGHLHRDEDGKFSSKEMAHFLTEDWIALKSHLLVQTNTPWDVSEYDAAGGIKGVPIDVINR